MSADLNNNSPPKEKNEEGRNFDKRLVILGGLTLIILLIATPAVYFYYQWKKTSTYIAALGQTYSENPSNITDKVGKLIQLPYGETPTVVKITDAAKAKEKPFLWKAENGDILLIYTKAKQAILYDPVLNKVKQVGPLIMPTTSASPSASPK